MSSTGVLTLRAALRRARHLGASVSYPNATGEVRVAAMGRRLNINNRRKDAPKTLMALLTELEANPHIREVHAMDEPTPVPIGAHTNGAGGVEGVPPPLPITYATRIRLYLDGLPEAADGWKHFGSTNELADELGIPAARVVTALNYMYSRSKGDRWEALRDSGGHRIVAMRRVAPTPQLEQSALINHLDREAQAQAEPEPIHLGVIVPETPTLAAYAEARKIARDNPLLQVRTSEDDVEAMLKEAVRLYYWVMASKPKP